jgi:hypothetical protein
MQVRESSSRFWPANNEQHYQAWISFASERSRYIESKGVGSQQHGRVC